MSSHLTSPRLSWKIPLFLAVILAGCAFVLQAHVGFNVADEGFLWYGVQRTVVGEVPLRDFQAYDPGRYYWCAGFAAVLGKGLVTLRSAEAVAQALGLWVGLLLASRLKRDVKFLLVFGVGLTLWMFPSYKIFDHALLLTGLYLAVRMIEMPSRGRVLLAGAFVGLATFVGRNHALYNFVAVAVLLSLLHFKLPREAPLSRFVVLGAGIVAGCIPILLMLALVPGFFEGYRDSIESIFRNGANLGIPVPWPWRVSGVGSGGVLAERLLVGSLFLILPLFYLATIGVSLRMSGKKLQENALLVGCGFVGVVYLHHAFSRADFSHLAQASHPFTLGVCAAVLTWKAASRIVIWLAAISLGVIAFFGGAKEAAWYQQIRGQASWEGYQDSTGETLRLPSGQVKLYQCVRYLTKTQLKPKEMLLIAPYHPGLYPLLERRSPLHETFFFFPAPPDQERRDIERLAGQRVNWALIGNGTIDRRDDLRFPATHPLLAQYLDQNFAKISTPCLPPGLSLLRRKEPLASR